MHTHTHTHTHAHMSMKVIKASVMDLGKLVQGSANQLDNLQQVCDVINTNQLEKLYVEVESNTKVLVDAGAALERYIYMYIYR